MIMRLDKPIAGKRTQKKCNKYGGLGHNKKTCKGLASIDGNGRRCNILFKNQFGAKRQG